MLVNVHQFEGGPSPYRDAYTVGPDEKLIVTPSQTFR